MRLAFCGGYPLGYFRGTSSCSKLHLGKRDRRKVFVWHERPIVPLRRRLPFRSSATAEPSSQSYLQSDKHDLQVQSHTMFFRGFKYFYLSAEGTSDPESPAVVLVHGFGANCRHWRNNILPLAKQGWRVFAIDLLGFGLGDKPVPGLVDSEGDLIKYTFEFWSDQLRRFCDSVVRKNCESKCKIFFVANSIGSMVTMQASIDDPSLCSGNVFISPSLRQLNVRKRSWLQSVAAPLAMRAFMYRPLGEYFLQALSRKDQIRKVLLQAYAIHQRVDEELIEILRQPALTDGALDVFLAFITYDSGPVPEDLLPRLTCPSLIAWGDLDTFEPYEAGRALRHYATVERFITLRGVGHCGHDEKPDEVNEIIAEFFLRKLDTWQPKE